MGHTTPEADLMVLSQSRHAFLVDVKGLYKKNSWVVSPKEARSDLYYILAFVPDEGQNEFFIMSQEQVHQVARSELKRLGRSENYAIPGFGWPCVQPYKNQWQNLPGWSSYGAGAGAINAES